MAIATGVKFMMGGTQGHNYNWIAAYPLDFLDEDFDGYTSIPPNGFGATFAVEKLAEYDNYILSSETFISE